jgi:hypothetical protein
MIKMRLGGSGDPFEPFPQKPRRMHWRTYERLREQARAADADAEGLLAQSMPGFKELLALSGVVDPPPRRYPEAPWRLTHPLIETITSEPTRFIRQYN